MHNNLGYRTMLGDDYDDILKLSEIHSNHEKEKIMMRKYFKRNYLSMFPTDKSSVILDVACGRGMYIDACISNGYKNVSGIDLSPSNIEFCRSQGYLVEKANLFDFLKVNKSKYDIIMLNDVIEHFYKDEALSALNLLHDALMENGLLIIKTFNAANPYTASASRYIAFDHEIGFTECSLDRVLRGVGFRNVCVKGLDIYVTGGLLVLVAKLIATLVCFYLRLMSILFGRTSIKIFTKNLIAFANK